MSGIARLAAMNGVADHYFDFRGERRAVPAAVQAQILEALGLDPARPDDQAATLEEQHNDQLAPAAVVCQESNVAVALRLRPGEGGRSVRWQLKLEEGWARSGELGVGPGSGAAADSGGRIRVELPLGELPRGYHQLTLETVERCVAVSVIAVPRRCFEPPELAAGRRLWGLSVQLYSLRSARNWGIGDLGDLRRLIDRAAVLGVDFIGLNPLHALSIVEPEHASPYSPSSRLFLNPVYIDLTAVPGFKKSRRVKKLLDDAGFQAELQRLRDADYVDYRAVTEAKLAVLGVLYRRFRRRHLRRDTRRAQEYLEFVGRHGVALRQFALYQALAERLHAMDPAAWGWPAWPEAYRQPDAEQVQLFAATNGPRIEFFMFLQWLADRQLAAAQAAARAANMVLGLYRDLAVGSGRGGAEIWTNQALFATRASVGAPPDALALQGQDWGVPPIKPRALREQGYRGFIDLIRANMRHAGALRIDHVMALLRLWWVPQGNAALDGSYVDYPLNDLLGIVALESCRTRCLVVGEDLGTVPDAVREAMAERGVYSYRVLYFEKDGHNQFRAPADHPEQSLITLTTHDLPSLWAYWTKADIQLRSRLGLYPSDEVRDAVLDERDRDRGALLFALQREELLPDGLDTDPRSTPDMTDELAAALEQYLARGRSRLLTVHPEDWLAMTEPVNVPGTHGEYPNWRRKLTLEWPALLARNEVAARARAISAARR